MKHIFRIVSPLKFPQMRKQLCPVYNSATRCYKRISARSIFPWKTINRAFDSMNHSVRNVCYTIQSVLFRALSGSR